MRKRQAAYPLILSLIVSAVPAAAETVVEVSLIQDGVVSVTEHPVLPGGFDVVMGTSEWQAPKLEDPASPFNGLTGTCFGLTEFHGDEITGGEGYCAYTDSDGDHYASSWKPTQNLSGGTAGEWTAIGGTGKWEGVTGSGTYQTVRISGQARQRTLTGSVTMR